jgi:hypothetical protein
MFAYSIVWFFKNWYQLSALSKHETSLPVDEETTAALLDSSLIFCGYILSHCRSSNNSPCSAVLS